MIDPRRTALLAMDFQNGIVAAFPDAGAALARAAEAIELIRARGGTVGYVRVAFTDEDFDRIPEQSPFAAMLSPEQMTALNQPR